MDVNDQLFVYSHLTALKHITPPSHCCSLCYELCCLNGFPPLEELWAGSVERHLMAAKWIHTQIRRGLQTQQSNNSCQRERERERERGGAAEEERVKRDRSWREKYKDVKTNGVCERKMRKNRCRAILPLNKWGGVWERAEQGVTLVVRKSIDCHSRHYFLSQETKTNRGGGCDGWHLMQFWISPPGGHSFVPVGAHIWWLILEKHIFFHMPSIYQGPLTVAPKPVSLYVKRNKREEESEAQG